MENIFQKNNIEENDFNEIYKNYKGGGTLELMTSVFGDIYTKDELEKMSDDKK